MKYSWSNISEYYSGGTRLSSFSTTIRNDGSITTNYYNLDLTSSNVSVGTVGDPSKGEYNQVFWAPAGTRISNGTIADWTQAGSGVDTCSDPTSSPSCPGYAEAMLKLIPSSPASTNTTETTNTYATPLVGPNTTLPTNQSTGGTTTTTESSTSTVSSAPVTSAAPTALNPQPKIGEVQTAGSSKPSPSMSQIMNIVAGEQSRVQQAEKMVADQVKDIATQVTINAEAVATSAAAQSISSANESSVRSLNSSAVANSLTGVPGSGLNVGLSISGQQAFGVPETSQVTSEVFSTTILRPQTVQMEVNTQNEKRPTDDPVLKEAIGTNTVQVENQEERQKPSVNTNAKDNDASSGGVTIASIAVVPAGFQAYSLINLKDAPFYPPTEVYKNQTTVDNLRVLRLLNARSDRTHQEMIDLQYKKGN